MCTLYSITTNQDAIKALFRVTRDAPATEHGNDRGSVYQLGL